MDELLTESIIPYCERLTTGAEPFNVSSNIAFVIPLIYGIITFRATRQDRLIHDKPGEPAARAGTTPDYWHLILITLTVVIGCGSAIFHYYPTRLTHLLDIVPIIAFALLTTVLVLNRSPHTRTVQMMVIGLWVACSGIATAWPDILAHSLFYVPTVALLAALTYLIKTHRTDLAILTAVFAIALLARALDLQVCNSITIGTHLVWHLLAAIACTLCLRIVFTQPPEPGQQAV